jgi:hypothetical protein
MQDDIFIQCAAPGCCSEFAANSKGKRFCSAACRARGSEEMKFKARLAHRRPEQTPERRALKLAAGWLAIRLQG